MDIYFNPYTNSINDFEIGKKIVIEVADTLYRLKKEISLYGCEHITEKSISNFILVSDSVPYSIKNIFCKIDNQEKDKLRLMLLLFSKGRKIDYKLSEDWMLKTINIPAPILEMAAKNNSISLTISDDDYWRKDFIEFDYRDEKLRNIWGQKEISYLIEFCNNSIEDIIGKFQKKYNADFCDGSFNDAPEKYLWEKFDFFKAMDKAKSSDYKIDGNLLKGVDKTNFGILYELRCYESGWRIFFSKIKDKLLIGGFYQKASHNQNNSIKKARERLNKHQKHIK